MVSRSCVRSDPCCKVKIHVTLGQTFGIINLTSRDLKPRSCIQNRLNKTELTDDNHKLNVKVMLYIKSLSKWLSWQVKRTLHQMIKTISLIPAALFLCLLFTICVADFFCPTDRDFLSSTALSPRLARATHSIFSSTNKQQQCCTNWHIYLGKQINQ